MLNNISELRENALPTKRANPPKNTIKQPVSKKGLIISNRTHILYIIFFFL